MANFNSWMQLVEKECYGRFGVSHSDLEDGPWHDYHDDGLTPEQAVQAYVEDGWSDFASSLEDAWDD